MPDAASAALAAAASSPASDSTIEKEHKMRLQESMDPSTSGGAAESTSSMCVQPAGGAVDVHNDRRGPLRPSLKLR